jgi:hypothetical protein
MKLPETHVEPFELFYNWLSSQKWWDKNSDQVEWPQMYHVIKLYVFADMARIPILQNQCIDTLRGLSNALASLPTPTFAYDGRTQLSVARFAVSSLTVFFGSRAITCSFGEFAYKGLANTNMSRDNGGNEGSLLEKHKGSRVHQFLFAFEGPDEILRAVEYTRIPNEVIAMSAFSSHIQSSSLRLLQLPLPTSSALQPASRFSQLTNSKISPLEYPGLRAKRTNLLLTFTPPSSKFHLELCTHLTSFGYEYFPSPPLEISMSVLHSKIDHDYS